MWKKSKILKIGLWSFLGTFGMFLISALLIGMIVVIVVLMMWKMTAIFDFGDNTTSPHQSVEAGTNAIYSKTSDYFYSFFKEKTDVNYENFYIKKGNTYTIVPEKYLNYQLFWYHCNPVSEYSETHVDCSYLDEGLSERAIKINSQKGDVIDGIYKYPLLKIFNPVMYWQSANTKIYEQWKNGVLNQYNVIDTHDMITKLTHKNSININSKLLWFLSSEQRIPYLNDDVYYSTWYWRRVDLPWVAWTNGFNDLESFYGFWWWPWKAPYLEKNQTPYLFAFTWNWSENVKNPLEVFKPRYRTWAEYHTANDYWTPNWPYNGMANPFFWWWYYLGSMLLSSQMNTETAIISKYWAPYYYYEISKNELVKAWRDVFLNTFKKANGNKILKESMIKFILIMNEKTDQQFLTELDRGFSLNLFKAEVDYKESDIESHLMKDLAEDKEKLEILWKALDKYLFQGSEELLANFGLYSILFNEDTLFTEYPNAREEKVRALVNVFWDFKNYNEESISSTVKRIYEEFLLTGLKPDLDEVSKKKIMLYEIKHHDFYILKAHKQSWLQNSNYLVKKYIHILSTAKHIDWGNQHYQSHIKSWIMELGKDKLDKSLAQLNNIPERLKQIETNYSSLYSLVVNNNLNVNETDTSWWERIFWGSEETNKDKTNKLLSKKEEALIYKTPLSIEMKDFNNQVLPEIKGLYDNIKTSFNKIKGNTLSDKALWLVFETFMTRGNYTSDNKFVNAIFFWKSSEDNAIFPFVKYGDYFSLFWNSGFSKWPHSHTDIIPYYTDSQVLTHKDLEQIRDQIYWKDGSSFTNIMWKVYLKVFEKYQNQIEDISTIVSDVDKKFLPIKDILKKGIRSTKDKEKVIKAWRDINAYFDEGYLNNLTKDLNSGLDTNIKIDTNNINLNFDKNSSSIGAGSMAGLPSWGGSLNFNDTNNINSFQQGEKVLDKINKYVGTISDIKKESIEKYKDIVFLENDKVLFPWDKDCDIKDIKSDGCQLRQTAIDWNLIVWWLVGGRTAEARNTAQNTIINNHINVKRARGYAQYYWKMDFNTIKLWWRLWKTIADHNFFNKLQAYTYLNKIGAFIKVNRNLPIFSHKLHKDSYAIGYHGGSIIDTAMLKDYLKSIGLKSRYQSLVRWFWSSEDAPWSLYHQWSRTGFTQEEINTIARGDFPDSIFDKFLSSNDIALSATYRKRLDDDLYLYRTLLLPSAFLKDHIITHWWYFFNNPMDSWRKGRFMMNPIAFWYYYAGEFKSFNFSKLWEQIAINTYSTANVWNVISPKRYNVKNAIQEINGVIQKAWWSFWQAEKEKVTWLVKTQILWPLYRDIYITSRATNLSFLKEGLWWYTMTWFLNPNTSVTANLGLYSDIIKLNQLSTQVGFSITKNFEEGVKESFLELLNNSNLPIKLYIEKNFDNILKAFKKLENKNYNRSYISDVNTFINRTNLLWSENTIEKRKDLITKILKGLKSKYGLDTDYTPLTIKWDELFIDFTKLGGFPLVLEWNVVTNEWWKPVTKKNNKVKFIPFDVDTSCTKYADIFNWGCWLTTEESKSIKTFTKDLKDTLSRTTWRSFHNDALILDAVLKYNYDILETTIDDKSQKVIDILKSHYMYSSGKFFELFYAKEMEIDVNNYLLVSGGEDDFFIPMEIVEQLNKWMTFFLEGEEVSTIEWLREKYLKTKQRFVEYYQPIASKGVDFNSLNFLMMLTHLKEEETGFNDMRYDCVQWMWCRVNWKCIPRDQCIAKIESGEKVLIGSGYKNSKSFNFYIENWKASFWPNRSSGNYDGAWVSYLNNEASPNGNPMAYQNVNIKTIFKNFNTNWLWMYGIWQFDPWSILFDKISVYRHVKKLYWIDVEKFWYYPDGKRYLNLAEEMLIRSSWKWVVPFLSPSFKEDFLNNIEKYYPPANSNLNCYLNPSWKSKHRICKYISGYNLKVDYWPQYLRKMYQYLPEYMLNVGGWWSAFLNIDTSSIANLLFWFVSENPTLNPTKEEDIQNKIASWIHRRILDEDKAMKELNEKVSAEDYKEDFFIDDGD